MISPISSSVGGSGSIDGTVCKESPSAVGVGGGSESYSIVFPLRKLSRLANFGIENAGDDNGGVINAGFWSRAIGVGNVKFDETANDRR